MTSVQLETPHSGKYTQPTGLFINNEFVKGVEGKTFEVINPTDESVITSVHEATEKDVDIAVAAARKAFEGPWRKETPENRGKLIVKLANLFEENLDLLAAVESLDNGKAINMAKVDISMCVGCLRYYGGWADKIEGRVIDTNPDTFNYAKKEPIGVCAQIIPWNFPLLMWAWKIGPAIACGNTVVLKTAEQTPLGGLVAAKLIKEAGFPPGVVNIISGFGKIAGAALSSHMDIDKVAFTGSTVVGRQILKAAASSNLKKVTLELGGKSPNIILKDADLDQAVSWAAFGVFFNTGQCCCAGTRVYVEDSIYDKFMEKMMAKIKSIKTGDGFKADTFQGPAVSQLQFDRVMAYIESGKQSGAKVVAGGQREGNEGYFVQPTIFTDVPVDSKINREEIFGPVVVCHRFKDQDDLIRMANDSVYGLAAAVFSRDISRALETAHALQAGTVWVNCYNQLNPQVPFGGYKTSGIGREMGEYALANYTQVKAVHVNLNAPAPL